MPYPDNITTADFARIDAVQASEAVTGGETVHLRALAALSHLAGMAGLAHIEDALGEDMREALRHIDDDRAIGEIIAAHHDEAARSAPDQLVASVRAEQRRLVRVEARRAARLAQVAA